MLPHSLRRTIGLLALTGSAWGCGDELPTGIVAPTVLRPGTWYLHQANAEALPALIAERTVGIAIEKTYLDSATITVATDGTWEQKVYLSVLVTDVLDREELMFDRGAWEKLTFGYGFTSTLRTRSFTATIPFVTLLSTTESVLSWTSAPGVTGQYYQTPP
jgi:hypothetical protein